MRAQPQSGLILTVCPPSADSVRCVALVTHLILTALLGGGRCCYPRTDGETKAQRSTAANLQSRNPTPARPGSSCSYLWEEEICRQRLPGEAIHCVYEITPVPNTKKEWMSGCNGVIISVWLSGMCKFLFQSRPSSSHLSSEVS